VRVADPGGEHRHEAPDVIHRRAQTGRHLPGVSRNERWPRRFGDMLLASWCSPTIPSSSGPAGRTRAYGSAVREPHLTTSQITPAHLPGQLPGSTPLQA
jgi:hypothetical protein